MSDLFSETEGTWLLVDQTTPTDEDIAVAQSAYITNKPTLIDTDIYELIRADISVNGNQSTGIINCRVNGDHQQFRF